MAMRLAMSCSFGRESPCWGARGWPGIAHSGRCRAPHPAGVIRAHPARREPAVPTNGTRTVSAPPVAAETLGDRVEHAIEARTEVVPQAEPPRRLRRTIFWLVVTGISIYLVFPSLLDVFGSWRDITRFS